VPTEVTAADLLDLVTRALDPDNGLRAVEAAGRVYGILYMRDLNGYEWAAERLRTLAAGQAVTP
jgi:hypothetical protein